MKQVEAAIGRDMSAYRVAHLGISPAPSLMHGFYTVDGYSNNYPLEYKHRFRQVIETELEKNESTRLYFDQWGSRCYLFNGTSGTYWNMGKHENVKYENLEFDTNQLKEMGGKYIFAGMQIANEQELGLKLMREEPFLIFRECSCSRGRFMRSSVPMAAENPPLPKFWRVF